MMANEELPLPPFLDEDEDDIHERMLEDIPNEFDSAEGSLVWDVTRPTALEIARLKEFDLIILLQTMFPQFAEGVYLDYHGEKIGVLRRQATYATGQIAVEGVEGTFIPAGTTVTTDEVDGVTFEYRTVEDATIDASGIVYIPIEAIEPGASSNIPANSIVNFLEPISGVYSVTNQTAVSGGINEESDESYRERIILSERTTSFTGNRMDYIQWAKEIPGVGNVWVTPEWNGPGTVKVMISNQDGGLASPELIQQVQEHIAPDGRAGGGLAPIGALVTVTTIDSESINVSFYAELQDGFDAEITLQEIRSGISNYLTEIEQGGLVRSTRIGAIVSRAAGVVDYWDLKINGKAENYRLGADKLPKLGEVEML